MFCLGVRGVQGLLSPILEKYQTGCVYALIPDVPVQFESQSLMNMAVGTRHRICINNQLLRVVIFSSKGSTPCRGPW